jgi:sulfur-oxidizing protein SoxZ
LWWLITIKEINQMAKEKTDTEEKVTTAAPAEPKGSTTRLKAVVSAGITEIKALMKHPMESGLRKDKESGKLVPAHFIEEVTCEYNGKVVMSAVWSGGISANPYLSFKFKGGKAGEKVKLSWKDNQGGVDTVEVAISE